LIIIIILVMKSAISSIPKEMVESVILSRGTS